MPCRQAVPWRKGAKRRRRRNPTCRARTRRRLNPAVAEKLMPTRGMSPAMGAVPPVVGVRSKRPMRTPAMNEAEAEAVVL